MGKMNAIVIREPGGPEVLEWREVPLPEPGPFEARVRVHATAVNRADLLQRRGAYPAPPDAPEDIPGLEYAGVVDRVGTHVTRWKVGDSVFGITGGGAYAEALVLHERLLSRAPAGIALEDAAALPEAFLTAYDAMVTQASLGAGETVLIHAAGSGVGTAATQVARAIGARAIGTARTADKLERAKELGLHAGVVTQDGAFAEPVLAATGGRGVDVVLELVGGSYVREDLQCIAPRGRIALVGLVGGRTADIDLGVLLRKRASMFGTVLRARPLEEKIALAHVLAKHLTPLFESKALIAIVGARLPLAEAAKAHALLEANDSFGKVVLTVAGG